MSEVYLTRQFDFSASHRYWREQWSPEQNRKVFGATVNDHGHNYLLEVTVAGTVDEATGMVMNMTDLKGIVSEVLEQFDHKNLNKDLPYFREDIPTSENVAKVLWGLLRPHVKGARLVKLRLAEDEDMWVEYTGKGNPGTSLSRRYKFSAAHLLYSPALTPEQNRHLYGKCSNPQGHGHNYELIVTVGGPVDPTTGMCMDLEELDRVVRQQVISRYDHKNLNQDVEEFHSAVPTGENIVRAVWRRLSQALPAGCLKKLRLVETKNNYFEYSEGGAEGS
jgi:6-pyruvoyltetrahydropterin/6-carboxytetrahydropterin synthase